MATPDHSDLAPEPAVKKPWLVALPFVAIASFVTLRVYADFGEPVHVPPEWVTNIYPDRWSLYGVMGYASIFFAVLAAARMFARVRNWLDGTAGRRTTATLLTAAVLAAGLNYTYFARVLRQPGWVQTHDSLHYTLAAKYFPELGYTNLYDCVLLTKAGRYISGSSTIRDLDDYTFGRVSSARRRLAQEDTCRPRFSDERWEQFEADLEGLFRISERPGRVNGGSIRDKGYNGTPLHAFVAGKLGNAAGTLDVVTVARMNLIDVWGICAIGFFLCLGFGWRAGMVCSVYYFVAAADRFDMVGGSPSRYYWMVFLALGAAALARRRWVTAGAGLTLSTALVAFPIFYWIGAAAALGGELLRQRAAAARRFLVACTVSGAICLALGAAHGGGVGNYAAWVDDMSIHSADSRPRSIEPGPITATPGFGLGLKFAMMYSVSEEGKRDRAAKLLEYRSIRPYYRVLGAVLVLLGLVIATRLRAAAACVLVGTLGFWALQGTVGYYFVCASLLPALLGAGWRSDHRRTQVEALDPGIDPKRDKRAPQICALLEAALWGLNAYALLTLVITENRFVMLQRDLSFGLGIWMLAALLVFAWLGQPFRLLLESSVPVETRTGPKTGHKENNIP